MTPRVSVVCLTLATFLALGAMTSGQVTVKGDAKGWEAIKAAWRKLPTLKTYRIKIASDEMSGTMTVVAPDRMQMAMAAEGTTSESITVGQETRFRQGGGAWQCGPGGGLAALMTPDMFAIGEDSEVGVQREVTVTRGQVVAIDGVQTQSYTFSMRTADESEKTRVFIETASGLPKRMEMLNEDGAVRQTVTVFDANASITISLPACK